MRMKSFFSCFLLTVLIQSPLQPQFVSGQGPYLYYCDIRHLPVVTLVYNHTSQRYYAASNENRDDDALSNGNTSRSLNVIGRTGREMEHVYSDLVERYSLSDPDLAINDTIQMRLCYCAEKHLYPEEAFYCPLDKTHCAVPGTSGTGTLLPPQEPVCVSLQSSQVFAESVWPVLLIWYGLAFLFCVGTHPGRNAMAYVLGTFCPCWIRRRVRRMMELRSARIVPLMHQYWIRNREVILQQQQQRRQEGIEGPDRESTTDGHPEGAIPSIELVAGTNPDRVISAPGSSCLMLRKQRFKGNNHNGDSQNCTICFMAIELGDTVGVLNCSHIFHVDCLKSWLRRRNVCPLCLTEAATVSTTPSDSVSNS